MSYVGIFVVTNQKIIRKEILMIWDDVGFVVNHCYIGRILLSLNCSLEGLCSENKEEFHTDFMFAFWNLSWLCVIVIHGYVYRGDLIPAPGVTAVLRLCVALLNSVLVSIVVCG